ncbi:4Fe-4S binding protein [Rubrivivax gelatinosus]|uniref:4Fe-4S binding protein n=1 Tax=Rubrivivax gelatinosus TaxID=28068 RepID=UPI0019041F6D|nr:4Fe-4S binding protein [Rubrivivax gelatinosus]
MSSSRRVVPIAVAEAQPRVGRIEAFFVHQRERFVWLQAAMCLVFVVLVFLPPWLPEPTLDDGVTTHLALAANYAMWGLWFPLVLLSVVLTGRSWCGLLCPMGAASEWASRVGLQRPVPRWLRWSGVPVVSFIVVTILGQTLGVREHPEAVLIVFGGTMALAVLFGAIWARGKRPWCRHACPIGLLLGVFSRLGAVQFEPKRPVPGGERYAEIGLCPTMIDIARKQASRHCIECFRCVHPQSQGGERLRLRRPGLEVERIREHAPDATEVWFFFLATGTALGGFLWLMLPSYQELRGDVGRALLALGWSWIGNAAPAWIGSSHPQRGEVFSWLDVGMIAGYMLFWAAATAAMLALATAISAWLAGQAGADGTLRSRFVELGYLTMPVALVSLVIGLGSRLFEPLQALGEAAPGHAKQALFGLAVLWSLHLGNRILALQGVPAAARWRPLLPSMAGIGAVGLSWWAAIFGL